MQGELVEGNVSEKQFKYVNVDMGVGNVEEKIHIPWIYT